MLGDKPLVAETPESLLDDDVTPTEKFFVRNNGSIPEESKDPATPGSSPSTARSTTRSRSRSASSKSKFKAVTRRMVLECGGNGRAVLLAAGARQPVDQWRRRLRRMDRRAARRRAQEGRGLKAQRQISPRIMRADLQLSGDASKPTHLARRAHREGDGPEHPDRVRDERPAAAAHPWRAGAPDRAGLGRLGVAANG